MLCRDIMKTIENTYPKHAAMDWDNVGLLVGRVEKNVQKIYVALDLSDEVIADAILQEADLIITHHPLIFVPQKQITDEEMIGRRVMTLLQHDISYYAMHTNYDVLRMAQLASDVLELRETEILEVTDSNKQIGLGRVGQFSQKMSVRECAELVKARFGLEAVKIYGNLDAMIQRVAISPGSGKHMSQLACEKNAEVFITAEIDHHEGIDANAEGLIIMDAGHYGLEHIFIRDVATFLQQTFENMEVIQADIRHPFHII